MEIKPIAYIESEFKEKFGIPRQSGLVEGLKSTIVFEKEYQKPEAFRELDGYSHIWLLWEFSENIRSGWSPTVRPPRLGGNKRVGVFATRSPFRPNPIGMSLVKLEKIEMNSGRGPLLVVGGADLMDGTPIYDIKPYLPHVDSCPNARGGFAEKVKDDCLTVKCTQQLLEKVEKSKRDTLLSLLANDPRPAYKEDENRVYGMNFAGMEVKFRVENKVVFVERIES